MSTVAGPRVRKRPEERREEMIVAAAQIALDEGLERITLRAVADRLGVRPGLVTHYFPAAETLVVAAFAKATSEERMELISDEGTPLARLRRFVSAIDDPDAARLARLWLNARHLARFSADLAGAVEEQEALDRERLSAVIGAGVAAGEIGASVSVDDACVRIWMAVDGKGAYANDRADFTADAYAHFVADAAEWALALPVGTLREV